jgi:hypothetical protein
MSASYSPSRNSLLASSAHSSREEQNEGYVHISFGMVTEHIGYGPTRRRVKGEIITCLKDRRYAVHGASH